MPRLQNSSQQLSKAVLKIIRGTFVLYNIVTNKLMYINQIQVSRQVHIANKFNQTAD